MKLIAKTVLITGAAGRIGSSVALAALTAGAKVVLSDISAERLVQLEKKLISSYLGSVFCIVSDASSPDGIDILLQKAHGSFGVITSAVHCAYPMSAGWGAHFEELEAKYLHQDLSMQLGGAILFSQKILKYFQIYGGGDLIHISSIQGVCAPKFEHYEGTNMTSPIEYAAIKAGIISITGWLAKYHANQGIRVNCVSPGGVLDAQPNAFLKRYRQSCTNIGMLSAEQVASAVIFLLSPAASAINGQNLIVDDGWSL